MLNKKFIVNCWQHIAVDVHELVDLHVTHRYLNHYNDDADDEQFMSDDCVLLVIL